MTTDVALSPADTTFSSSSEHTGTHSSTSASSTDGPISQAAPLHIEASLSRDAIDFLSDLNNYLPLGCLYLEDNATDVERSTSLQEWQDVTQIPFLDNVHIGLTSHLTNLATAGWIRIRHRQNEVTPHVRIVRIYILPGDVGHRFIDRQNKKLALALESLVVEIDVSPETWVGKHAPGKEAKFDMWATRDEGSLFYMFNKLPSPSPQIAAVKDRYAREALEDLLDAETSLHGLKTGLYPYQRRSAGLMLQRESVSKLELDPRLERRIAPDGSHFYFSARDLQFFRQPRFYESSKGGILAETMGLGKTLICLSVILATRSHLPKVPSAFQLPQVRPETGSLASMAVAVINRKSVPWKVEFERIRHASGDDMGNCTRLLDRTPPMYEVPQIPTRWNRNTVIPPPEIKMLAATTLIVVPRNLCRQWQSEIKKHIDEDMLRILVMEDPKRALPEPSQLRKFDIILFSRNRFELENKHGADDQGRRMMQTPPVCRCSYIGATRTRDCNCVKQDELYVSPLKSLHFKRLIIDEGHFFSSKDTTAVIVANKLVKADHRWVVSGTPAKDLLGVEVDMSAAENLWQTPETKECRDAVLDQRRQFSIKEDTSGAIKSLGALASHFLKIRPWHSSAESDERPAAWEEYIYRHEGLRRRTFSGFSVCLRRTLESMVVKTQPSDVEKDIDLPPLSHEVVRLEPSFYDKLTANLFTLVLTANAVTSERTDTDYLFHKNSQKARYQLIANLRQSAFFWTGFSEADVQASLKNSSGYLDKEGTKCTEDDRLLLNEAMQTANTVLDSPGWLSMSQCHELGLFVEQWPSDIANFWAFEGSNQPLLTGVSQLLEAQKHVNERIGLEDPGEGLAGAGIKSLSRARQGEETESARERKPVLNKAGIPTSSLDGEPTLKRRTSLTGKSAKPSSQNRSRAPKNTKPKGQASSRPPPVTKLERDTFEQSSSSPSPSPGSPASGARSSHRGTKRRFSELKRAELPEDSPFGKTRIVGTTSAKLSYLASQVLKYYQHEKILIFYDGDNVAYYLAQMLELLHIKHEIYAKSLAAALKSEYVVRFDQQAQDRVLLMDVNQAAFGLNLSSASRIYFVNPVCRPNVEAQAIKRAHRIGQSRQVYVETLLLKGTIEEKMHERARSMTRSEHIDAKALEDDGGIRAIIQSARVMSIAEHEKSSYGQMAPLEEPQKLWARPGWLQTLEEPVLRPNAKGTQRTLDSTPDDAADSIERSEGTSDKGKTKKQRTLAFVEIPTTPGATSVDRVKPNIIDSEEDEPMMSRWRGNSMNTDVAGLSSYTEASGISARPNAPGPSTLRTMSVPSVLCE